MTSPLEPRDIPACGSPILRAPPLRALPRASCASRYAGCGGWRAATGAAPCRASRSSRASRASRRSRSSGRQRLKPSALRILRRPPAREAKPFFAAKAFWSLVGRSLPSSLLAGLSRPRLLRQNSAPIQLKSRKSKMQANLSVGPPAETGTIAPTLLTTFRSVVCVRPNKGNGVVKFARSSEDSNCLRISPRLRHQSIRNHANLAADGPRHHVAVPGDEETSATRIVSEAKENVDRDLICSGSSKVGNADIPWTHMHGSHMNRLWRPATMSDENVIFLGAAVRQLRIETASQEFVHTSRAPAGPDGMRDLRFLLALPSGIALMTQIPCQRRTSILGSGPVFDPRGSP